MTRGSRPPPAVSGRIGPREFGQQAGVDAAEAAVAHDQHRIAGTGAGGDLGGQPGRVLPDVQARAQGRERLAV